MFCVLVVRAGKPPAGLHLDVYKNDQLIRVGFEGSYFF